MKKGYPQKRADHKRDRADDMMEPSPKMTKYFSSSASSKCNSDLSHGSSPPVHDQKRGGADENTPPKAPRPVRPSDDSKAAKSTFGSAAAKPAACGLDLPTEYVLLPDVSVDDEVRSQHTCSHSRVCVRALQCQPKSLEDVNCATTQPIKSGLDFSDYDLLPDVVADKKVR